MRQAVFNQEVADIFIATVTPHITLVFKSFVRKGVVPRWA